MRVKLARGRTLALVVAFAMAGCGAGSGPGPQGAGGPPSGSGAPGPGMMGSAPGAGPGYHFSALTCAAPPDLPGSTVIVTLGDRGMTQMMGGRAPLGAHMMLRAVPATVPAGKVSMVAQNRGWRTHELVILPLAGGNTPASASLARTARSVRKAAWARLPPAAALARETASGRAR